MSVVRLATSRERPAIRACSDCRFYVPDITDFGRKRWKPTRRLPFIGMWREPDGKSHQFARCTVSGGRYASTERSIGGVCTPGGLMFDPSPAQASGSRKTETDHA